MTTNHIILAPHIDDEVIGCYSVLTNDNNLVTVIYFDELTTERRAEALNAAVLFGFTPYFGKTPDEVEAIIAQFSNPEVYVPARSDWHSAHRRINSEYRHLATKFYSIDMGNAKPLPEQRAAFKKQALDELFPSQASLWANDAKYYLFEAITEVDYAEYAVVNFERGNKFRVRVLNSFFVRVASALNAKYHPMMNVNAAQVFNVAASIVAEGEIEVTEVDSWGNIVRILKG